MKQVILAALALLLFLFLLPMLLFGAGGAAALPSREGDTPPPTLPAAVTPVPGGEADRQTRVTLYRAETGAVEELTMADYLWGVVAAEMPASFRTEALKAQAVAARTYALRKGSGGAAAHRSAMVCDDHTCCQAWLTRAEAAEVWGAEAAFYTDKIAAAVADTDGLVITYGGALIDAVFHSSSAGSTADAAEVWGTSVPYLKPVSTPEGEEVPNYHTAVTVSLEDFKAAIRSKYPQASFGEDYTAWFGPVTYTAAGAVAVLPAGGAPVTGAEYRALFGLRSPRFTLAAGEEGVTFSVTGYGHGAGMSQYGANALAAQGLEFDAILTHYYTGCRVERREEGKESGIFR